jgi:hypothetical protein
VYVTGTYSGGLTFGTATPITSRGGQDVFLIKYNPDGSVAWLQSAGGPDNDEATGIATLADGSVYIAGDFGSPIDNGAGATVGTMTIGGTTLMSAGYADLFVARFTSGGALTWAFGAGGAGGEIARAIATLPDGSAYIVGQFAYNWSFGSTELWPTSGADAFLGKLDANGTPLWAVGIGDQGDQNATAVSVAQTDGSVYVGGTYTNTLRFSPSIIYSGGTSKDFFVAKYTSSGFYAWSVTGGSSSDDRVDSLSTLADGTTFVGGFVGDSSSFGGAPLSYGAYLLRLTAGGAASWARNVPGFVHTVSALASGSVRVGGSFSGTGYFGAATLVSMYQDIFTAAYDGATGANLSAARYGGDSTEAFYSMATLADGTEYLVGAFSTSVAFGSTTLMASTSWGDVFVARRSNAGAITWAVQANTIAGTNIYFNSISSLPDGTTYVTGTFTGSASFGSTRLISAGGSDLFLAKYDPRGALLWVVRGGGTSQDDGVSVTTLADGTAYVGGSFRGTLTIGTTSVTSAGSVDAFLAKFSANGALLWVVSGGASGEEQVAGVSAVPDGSGIYMTGEFGYSTTFGATTLTSNGAAAGAWDIFLVKYNASGTVLWARGLGGVGEDRAGGVAALSTGQVYVAGAFSSTGTFGGVGLASTGAFDAFLARYDASGSATWGVRAGGTGFDYANAVAVAPGGAVYLGGSFSQSATFGSTTITGGGIDSYLARYDAGGSVAWAVQSAVCCAQDEVTSVATDSSGAAYVGGFFDDTNIGATRAFYLRKYDAAGVASWLSVLPAKGQTARAVSALSDGTSYIAGNFFRDADFGVTTLRTNGFASEEFLAKHAP